LNSGIHSPLGQDRKPPRQRRPLFTFGRSLAVVLVLCLAGISAYPFLRPADRFQKPEVADIPKKPADKPTDAKVT